MNERRSLRVNFVIYIMCAVPGATVKKLDISYPTNEFQKLVRLWDKYDANSMGLTIRHMKGYVVFLLRTPALCNLRFDSQILERNCPTLCFSMAKELLPSLANGRNLQRCVIVGLDSFVLARWLCFALLFSDHTRTYQWTSYSRRC